MNETLIETFHRLYAKEDSVSAMSGLMDIISEKVDCLNFEEINDLLINFNTKITSTTMMIGILRYTYKIRVNLTYWLDCLDKIGFVLTERSLDADKMLAGLR